MKVKSSKTHKILNSRQFLCHNENYVEITKKCTFKSDFTIIVEVVDIDKLEQPQQTFLI